MAGDGCAEEAGFAREEDEDAGGRPPLGLDGKGGAGGRTSVEDPAPEA